MSVFNENNQGYVTGKYPLFLGEKLGVYDNVHLNHPKIFELYEELKSIDWTHDEIDLTQTKMDLSSVSKGVRDVMLLNLAYQWKADSAIGNSMATLLLPFITNSEYAHAVSRISENENLHSLTYSNIARQCLDDPSELFDLVYKTEDVIGRANSAIEALGVLDKIGCQYKLGMIDKEDVKPHLVKGIVAIFILERISFMNSFAATFALGSQQLFVGAAKYVQKICQDELIHFEIGRYVCKDLLKDPEYKEALKQCIPGIEKMLEETLAQELTWNTFLFSEGRSVVGLNKEKLDEWCKYNMQNVYDTLGLQLPYERLTKDPLPWFATDWVDLNSHQNANMEANNTNYQLNSIVDDGSEVEIDDDFDF